MAERQAPSRRACGPRLRRLTALTGPAARPSFATIGSTAGSGPLLTSTARQPLHRPASTAPQPAACSSVRTTRVNACERTWVRFRERRGPRRAAQRTWPPDSQSAGPAFFRTVRSNGPTDQNRTGGLPGVRERARFRLWPRIGHQKVVDSFLALRWQGAPLEQACSSMILEQFSARIENDRSRSRSTASVGS
jgi:hypothetical protein